MAQAAAAIFKIPTESPQPARGRASRAHKAATAQPKAASRVAVVETRAATRGDGEVIELELGITVYPPRERGGRWRAVWQEDGERQQCESVSQEKFAAKLEKVRQRLATRRAGGRHQPAGPHLPGVGGEVLAILELQPPYPPAPLPEGRMAASRTIRESRI